MSYLAMQYSGFPSHKVIGSGTVLDSARLRYHLAERLKVSPKSVHAYQVGEHGDSEFAIWSSANVGGQPVQKILKKADLNIIEEETKTAAYKIIERKGATYYGIGACVTSIVNCIFNYQFQPMMPFLIPTLASQQSSVERESSIGSTRNSPKPNR